jgi:hypothetical protein
MPALPNVPGVLCVVNHYNDNADTRAITKQYFSYTGSAPSSAQCVTIAEDISNAWGTHLASLYGEGGGLAEVQVTDLTSATSGQGVYAGGVSGTRSGQILSNAVALLMNASIARRYRGGKPRQYLPFGVATDVASGGAWAGAFTAAANTQYAAWIAAVSAITVGATTLSESVNVSYYQGFVSSQNPVTLRWRTIPKVRAGGPVVDTINAWIANGKPASQRRRNLHKS